MNIEELFAEVRSNVIAHWAEFNVSVDEQTEGLKYLDKKKREHIDDYNR